MKKTFLLALLLLTANCFAESGWVYQPRYNAGTANPSNSATAGNKGDLYFNSSSNSVFIKLDDFVSTNWFSINGGAGTTAYFARTCQITSAAAATPVNCLLASDVSSNQVPFITGFHGKVNGATNWATTTSCTIQDTNGTPVTYASVATTAMTGNAFVVPSTSGVTLSNAFALGSGGTAGKGINIVCNATGTGSTFVVTMEGYLH